MTKRELTEQQIENLKKGQNYFANSKEIARDAQKKSVESRKKNAEEKIRRLDANDYLWDSKFGTAKQINELWEQLSIKDKKDILMKLLPPDKQTNEIVGNIGVEKIYISPEEHKATLEHIKSVIEDGN